MLGLIIGLRFPDSDGLRQTGTYHLQLSVMPGFKLLEGKLSANLAGLILGDDPIGLTDYRVG